MFVLVLAAAVFFLFQGQQSLQEELQSANDQVRSAEKQQADIELLNSAVQSTLEALEVKGTVSAAGNIELSEQLTNSNQLNLTREAKEVQLATDLDNANSTVEFFDSQGSLITIVAPEVDEELIAGQPVELVIVATDHMGVRSIDFNIDNSPLLLGGPVEDAGLTAVKRHSWTPTGEGQVEIHITVTNVNGISSEQTVILTVIAPATNTPTPTVEPPPEATAEN
jgi:hypothetical protein